MEALRAEVRRLGRSFAAGVGAARARRWHFGLLVVAVALAFINTWAHPLPGLAAIEGRWVPVLICAFALVLLGYALQWLLGWAWRPRPAALARRLDDELGWRDETSTAVGIGSEPSAGSVPDLLQVQAAGRLAHVDAERLWPRPRYWRRSRLLLAGLFAFFLLAPGIDPFLEDGPAPPPPHGDAPSGRALDVDTWLDDFVGLEIDRERLPRAGDAEREGPR